MNDGLVKNFDILKGFGFITRPKGKDVFFHWSDIKSQYEGAAIANGTSVSFDLDDEKPNRARNVTINT